MKLAFSILSHKKPDALFEKLLVRLNEFPGSVIAIHHDYSQSDFPEELVVKYKLHMVTPHYKTKWAHISKIPALIDTFTKLYTVAPDLDWLISISPNCYPIKNKGDILSFFENSSYDYFMDSHPLGMQFDSIYKWHYEALFTKRIGQIPFFSRKLKFYWRHLRVPIDRNKTPFNDQMYPHAGSDWYFFNNKTLKRILDADIPNHPISQYIAKANEAPDKNASPVEILIQTYLNSQPDLIGSKNYYRFIDWKNAVDWHPNTLTIRHWDAIKDSSALFARKFDANKSAELLELIDNELLDKDK